MNLSWSCPARTIFGLGGLASWLADTPATAGGTRPIRSATVLADRSIVGQPVVRELRELLHRSGVRHQILAVDGPGELSSAVTLAERLAGGDLAIGVGGGSLLDQLKIAAVLNGNPEAQARLALAQRSGLILVEDLANRMPMVAIPTTLGTGAEASTSACLTHPGGKRLLLGDILRPDAAVLDPSATRRLPDQLVREGVLEPLFRLCSIFIADHEGRPTEDALTIALAQRLITLGDQVSTLPPGEASTQSHDGLRLEIAKVSALSHAAWLGLGRHRYSAQGWYIANELSTVLGLRKMTAVAALLPRLWDEIAGGQALLGSSHRMHLLWQRMRTVSDRELPADPAAGIRALLAAWRIDRHILATPDQVDSVARRSLASWGAGLPMLGRLRSHDVRRLVAGAVIHDLAVIPDLTRHLTPEPVAVAAEFPLIPSMNVGARRHRGLENTDNTLEEVNQQ